MQLVEAVALLKTGFPVTSSKTVWADLGCGSGLFTYALASLLQPGSVVYAIDKKPGVQHSVLSNSVLINPVEADFEKYNFRFGKTDGILMANSLHYVKDKIHFIKRIKKYMNDGACFLVVEYDTDEPVPVWVPYPASFNSLQILFEAAGYSSVIKLSERQSIYGNGNIYSAIITG